VAVTDVDVSPSNPSGVAGESNITLTCIATLSEPGFTSFTWSGPMLSRGPTTPQGPAATTFNDTVTLNRVGQSNAGTYMCEVSAGRSRRSGSSILTVTS